MSDQQKTMVTALFDIVADCYDNPSTRYFQSCAEDLVDFLQPAPGSKVLDVATGTGAAATSAAQAVGPYGRVHGIDLSDNMLDKAQKKIDKLALLNIDLHNMDAENPVFKSDYFDYAMCGFGLFFLEDMQGALTNWLRVLKPGGKLAISSFNNSAFTPQAQMFRDTLAEFGIEIPQASWFRLSSTESCHDLFNSAGLVNIHVTTKQHGYHLASATDWWDILWSTGFRGFLNQLSASDLATFRSKHLADIEKLRVDDGIWLDVETHFTFGYKPE